MSSDEEVEIGLLSSQQQTNAGDSSTETTTTKRCIAEVPLEDGDETTNTATATQNTETTNTTIDEEDELEGGLEMKAGIITQILVPVCITMVLVIAIVKAITLQDSVSQAMVYMENPADSGSTRFFGALLNSLIFVGMIIVVTVIFVVLYKYRCLKLIFAWLILSTGLMLGFFGGYLSYRVLSELNVPMDYITFAVVVWNFAIVGNIAIFYHASVKVNQAYLICISVILAVIFTRLPEWTTWTILGAIAIYDLFAVLCPKGPLRILVETAQERDEPIPALIYNASIIMMMGSSDEENPPQHPTTKNPSTQEEEEEKPKARGVKLGLGDFVFYSVLVGRAAMFDMLTVFASFIGIVTGLFCTILLLAIWRKALPALPISIAYGILFYFVSKQFLYPFVTELTVGGYVV